MTKVVGGALIAGATLAVWWWPEAKRQPPAPEPVRPVMSAVVAPQITPADIQFAARVKADSRRVLAFKQSGRIQCIPVKSGEKITKGMKLAWLDPLEQENELALAEANYEKDLVSYERKRAALARNAVSKEEVSQAEAAAKSSKARMVIAERALADTVLYAPFDGVVSKKYADELDMVTSSTKIMVVQDMGIVKVDAVIPETLVIQMKNVERVETNDMAFVTFDACPGRRYPARFDEYVLTSEDSSSQTYAATYAIERPRDLTILPGMSATVTIPATSYRIRASVVADHIAIPAAAHGVHSDGRPFVWVLEASRDAGADGIWVAHRRFVAFASPSGRTLLVKSGLKAGERIATAGITVLEEGRKVTLMSEKAAK